MVVIEKENWKKITSIHIVVKMLKIMYNSIEHENKKFENTVFKKIG